MRCVGIMGILAALATPSAHAMEANRSCPGMLEERGQLDEFIAKGDGPLLMDNECQALKSRELRLPLLEIPQEDEDPMALSLGAKNSGVVLRFKIPFSF